MLLIPPTASVVHCQVVTLLWSDCQLAGTFQVEFETLLLEYDNVAAALSDYVRKSGVRNLVMGSESINRFWRYFV